MTATCIRKLTVILSAAVIAVGMTACTGESANPPTTAEAGTTAGASVIESSVGLSATTVSSAPASPTPSVIDVPTPTPASSSAPLDPEAQEMADRAAIEAQWVKYWDVYINIVRTDPTKRATLATQVAIDPAMSNLLKSASYFESKGQDTYGTVGHRLSWLEPIGGAPEAVLADCQDQSQFGAIDTATKEEVTVGVDRDNVKGQFVKGDDGIWRVSDVYYLVDIPC